MYRVPAHFTAVEPPSFGMPSPRNYSGQALGVSFPAQALGKASAGMPSHKDKRKEKRRLQAVSISGTGSNPEPDDAAVPPEKKRKVREHSHKAPHQPAAAAAAQQPRQAQALGAWNPKATVVKGATLEAHEKTSLLLFYQYIQPLWSEVCARVPLCSQVVKRMRSSAPVILHMRFRSCSVHADAVVDFVPRFQRNDLRGDRQQPRNQLLLTAFM